MVVDFVQENGAGLVLGAIGRHAYVRGVNRIVDRQQLMHKTGYGG